MNLKNIIAVSVFVCASAYSLSYSYTFLDESNAQINFSAFGRAFENVSFLMRPSPENQASGNEQKIIITNQIIGVIESELKQEIQKETKVKVDKKQNLANKTFIEKETGVESLQSFEIKNSDLEVITKNEQTKTKTKTRFKKFENSEISFPNFAKNKFIDNKTSIEDLSEYEINNSELIKLSPIKSVRQTYKTFESNTVTNNVKEIVKDEVGVGQSSTKEKNVAPIEAARKAKEENKEDDKDDLVLYDYSKNKDQNQSISIVRDTVNNPRSLDAQLSETVKGAIDREMGEVKSVTLKPKKTKSLIGQSELDQAGIDLNSEDNIVYDYTKTQDSAVENDAPQVANFKSAKQTHFGIKAKEVFLNTQKYKSLANFEFVPDFDRSERVSDGAVGEINFDYSLVNSANTQAGIIQAIGVVPTRVELNLSTQQAIEVPLLNEDSLMLFLQNQGVNPSGGLMLLNLDTQVKDIEIDAKYFHKIFLNKSLHPVSTREEAKYVMFAEVPIGNVMIRFMLNSKEITQKIVFVGEGELYYEDPNFAEAKRETFSLTTRNLLSQKKKELVLNPDSIKYLGLNYSAKKKALNAYELKIPSLPDGMRNYLEFNHLSDGLYVGSAGEKNLEVPSADFISKVLEKNELNGLKERCIVQLNLARDLNQMRVGGKNRSGEMYIETSSIDSDGNFSTDNFEMAEKAFIVGDQEGQISARLDYTDGSSEFLKTFCSPGSYLVEQL